MTSVLPAWLRESWVRHYGVAVVSLKEKLAYRFDFFTALVWTLLMATLLYFLWRAIFESSSSIEMSLGTLITYVCMGQVIGVSRNTYSSQRPAFQTADRIRSGDIAIDLVRPVDYQALRLSDSLGLFFAEIVLINLPVYVFCVLVFGIDPPISPEAALGFLVSLVGAFLIAFSLNYLISLSSFWTFELLGIRFAQKALTEVLAGTIIPLSLFPGWLRTLALWLPLQGMAHVPLSIYVGSIEGSDIWLEIAKQLAWAVGMLLVTRMIWLTAMKRIVVQGG